MKRWRRLLLISVSMLITFMLLALAPFIFIGWLNLSSMKEHEKLQNNTKLNLEYLDLATKKLENSYNLILDKNLYDVEYIPLGGNNFSSPKTYIMKEMKTPLLKSVYLYSKKEDEFQVLLFQGDNKFLYTEEKDEDEGINFFIRVLGNFGFRKYILNDFLYDTTKGNDFKKIEEIFWEYQKKNEDINIFRHSTSWYLGVFVVYGESVQYSEKEKELEKWKNKIKEYFKEKTKLEEIDWYKFMKENNLKPRINFIVENISDSELKKLEQEIKPYYNSEEIDIALEKRGEN